ncbi:MAG TPA: PKD domain-containing protein, partial [Thermoanaerobaculia bacterium]|nr:PKD domain-containing protein [Thermoanaerobaculia bacterium]
IPDGATANVYVTYHGDGCSLPSDSCSAKADVAFTVSPNGYDLSCAQHTYSWDFGDGGHSTATAPSHRYTADGTYTVKVRLGNGQANADLTTTVKVTGAGPVVPPKHRGVTH